MEGTGVSKFPRWERGAALVTDVRWDVVISVFHVVPDTKKQVDEERAPSWISGWRLSAYAIARQMLLLC